MTARGEQNPACYYLDDLVVDRENFRLLKGDRSCALEPRVFDLLVFLIENRGRVVEKQEIFEQVWKQSFVTDNALTRAVKEIRRAIGDDASSPRYIETIPKRGYRFIAEVKTLVEMKQPPADIAAMPETLTAQGETARSVKSKFLMVGSKRRAALAVIIVIVAAAAALLYRRSANIRWAKQTAQLVEKLAGEQNYFEAYDLSLEVIKYLPGDETIARLMPTISDTISLSTEPPGASVFLKRFSPDAQSKSPRRELAGVTPITNLRIARGEYVLYVEKEGFAPVERTVSGLLTRVGNTLLPPDNQPPMELRLTEADNLPDRMVFVPGSKYRLVSWDRPTDAAVQLDDYFIDKFEVTNREYKEFTNAGGYLKKQYWRYPFVKGGAQITWEEAMGEFKDRTGLPGPRTWSGQDFPEGKAEHPVTGISWYEAAAYAAFRGKQLPTVFQWEKAARDGVFTHYSATIMPWGPVEVGGTVKHRANFKSDGPVAVDSFEFGMSPYGCYNMAGNVSEWCLNETSQGFITAGGSWDDLAYVFSYAGMFPGFYNSSRLGFRCCLNLSAASGDQGSAPIDTAREVPSYTPSSDTSFSAILSHYRYDKSPLNAQVAEVTETGGWRREKITYLGARDDLVIAYLYLPKNVPKPFQVIHFVPAGDVYGGFVSLAESVEMQLAPYINSGRAVFAVVLKGFKERERPNDYVAPSNKSVKRRDEVVENATDLRRGLDYLETRNDIDMNRLAYYGFSQGAEMGIIFAAVERRYNSLVFAAGGLTKSDGAEIAESAPVNFAPHIRIPKLMLNGRYDEAYSFKLEIEPLYKLLRDPKRLVVYDAGHSPPIETAVPIINGWLDETLGPVKRDS